MSKRGKSKGSSVDLEKLRSLAVVKENGMEKSVLDDRTYRLLTLPNQLEVLLVSDSTAVTSGASLSVNGVYLYLECGAELSCQLCCLNQIKSCKLVY